MKLHRWIRRTAIPLLAALMLMLAGGCGLWGSDETGGQIDPPQIDYDIDMNFDEPDQDVMAALGQEAPVTLYFKDPNGYVAPVGMRIPFEEGIARHALTYMIEGGPGESMLPEGFSALIPEGTQVLAMDIRDGLATVDFSRAFSDYDPQDERKLLEAVTWALTGFDTVDRVQLWVEGKPLKEMPQDGTPLDEPLTRQIGINLEIGRDVNPAVASAVTVYFQGTTLDDYHYYVPVTRLIRHTDDQVLAVAEQLAYGPASLSGLHGVLPRNTEVLDVSVHNDTVLINFAGDTVSEALSREAMEAVVLSLTEQSGLPKVQIMVDGQAGIQVGGKTEFTAPVIRPAQLNPVQS